MGIRCRFCSGLILPDHQPKRKPTHHSKCYLRQKELEEGIGHELSDKELRKVSGRARREYVEEQLNLINELPWYTKTSLDGSVKSGPEDGVPNWGLDQIERKIDIATRIEDLPSVERGVIKSLYLFEEEIKCVARDLRMSPHRVDWIRNKAIRRMGEAK